VLESRHHFKEIGVRLLVFLAVGVIVLAQTPSGEMPAIRSVGTMSDLMLDVIYPTSDRIFYVSRDEKKSEKDWIELRRSALVLAESANLLMAENRARDKDQWMKDARLLWEVGNKAFVAAKARDEAGLEALNAELYEACQSCHVHYRPGYRRRP
jgi:cytochrome c556